MLDFVSDYYGLFGSICEIKHFHSTPSSSAYVLGNLVTVVLLSAAEIEGMGVSARAEYI